MVVDLELPAFVVDAIILDPTPTTPLVINRDPEPDETQVPIDAVIHLEITDLSTAGIDTATVAVFVAGSPAFASGAFQPGFAGPGSSVTNPQPDTVRIAIDPVVSFSSLLRVPVRVVAQTVGGAFRLDTTWSFTCEDLTPPSVVGAQARELQRVRVSFDESVRQQDSLAPNDALNPELYTLVRTSAPAVSVAVIGVEPVTSTSVDLLTDIPLTPGATYRLEAVGVADAFGNAVAPPFHTADLIGFVPARPARRRFDLLALLPAINRREDETGDLRRFLACLQEVTDLLLHDIDSFSELFDPDLAPEPVLDAMLADLGNPFPFDLTVADKRRLLNILVAIYREKGTALGITNAVRFFLGIEIAIVSFTGEALVLGESLLGEDWILGPSSSFAAYSFEVIVPRALTDEERRRVRRIVEYMKPAHTHFVRLGEPVIPEVVDHLELGRSELGETWLLH